VGFLHVKRTESQWGCDARDLLGCLLIGLQPTSDSPFYDSNSGRVGVVEAQKFGLAVGAAEEDGYVVMGRVAAGLSDHAR
jgi:hypothetical protein